MNYAIIVAAGKSLRMGSDVDKAFVSLGTKPVLAYSLEAFEQCRDIDGIVLVVRKDRIDAARGLVKVFGCAKVQAIVPGGNSRQQSVEKGLAELDSDVRIVAVHDGARPCVRPALISETIKSAKRYGSGVAAVKVTDTIKQVLKGLTVTETIDRSHLWAVQTPQTFRVEWLVEAFRNVNEKKASVTDEASAVELLGKPVHLVASDPANLKITNPDDLALASAMIKARASSVET